MELPPYATDMDYKRCEKIVREIWDCEEEIQRITLEIMNISYATGGTYSSDVISAYAKTYIKNIKEEYSM